MNSHRFGFTLIELLLVIAIIAVMVAIMIIALNPSNGQPEARDLERMQHVEDILDAVFMYANDNGRLPDGIPIDEAGEICQIGMDCSGLFNSVNLDVLSNTYIPNVPTDPLHGDDNGTDYFIYQSEFGEVTVVAQEAELGEVKVSR